MVEVVETISSLSKGFELLWTIENVVPLTGSWNKKSPSFEALSRCWAMQAYLRQDPNSKKNKIFELNIILFGKEGNIVKERINETENVPFFNGSQFHKSFSFIGKNGQLLNTHNVIVKAPLNTQTMHMLSTEIFVDDSTFEKIARLRKSERDTILSIQIRLELRVLLASRNPQKEYDTIDRKKLFEGRFSDFTIRTGDGGEIRAHRAILDASSKYFEAMFASGGLEAQNSEISVPESFYVINEIVRFLYMGKTPEKEQFGANLSVVELYIATDKYQIIALRDFLETAFEAFLTPENVSDELVRAHLGDIESLKEKAANFFRSRRNEEFETEKWQQLCRDHPTLVDFLFNN